jgi:hypothetical protein
MPLKRGVRHGALAISPPLLHSFRVARDCMVSPIPDLWMQHPNATTHDRRVNTPLLCTLGHIATTQSLARNGVSRWRIDAALAKGTIIRVRRGTFACAHIAEPTLSAASIGGALACVSVLAEAGVWAGHSRALHVQLSSGAKSPKPPGPHQLHWGQPRFGMENPWRVSKEQALWRALHCLDEENALAALKSAIHEKFLPEGEVRRIARLAPRRLQPAFSRVVPNSGSGNETIVRLRLERAGHEVVAQGFVPGLGHQDLVVDDCLGLDVDGRRWHGIDRFAEDRDRDLQSEWLGRHVIRIRTSHIFATWPFTLEVIERAVGDALLARRGRG